MGSFDRYSNKADNAPFDSVVFGEDRAILEVELNEMQQIQNQKMIAALGIVGDCVLDRNGFKYNGTTLIMDTKVIKDGILINTIGAQIRLAKGESLYISSDIATKNYEDEIKANGNTAGAVIPNTMLDNRGSNETSRRKVLTFTLNKSDGMLLGSVINGEFVCLANGKDGICNHHGDVISIRSAKGGIGVKKIFGRSEQKQYIGKNLVNLSTGSMYAGVQVNVNTENQYMTVSGTGTTSSDIRVTKATLGAGTYKFYSKIEGTGSKPIKLEKGFSKEYVGECNMGSETTGTFTISTETDINISVIVEESDVYNITKAIFMICEDSYSYDYEPYVGGIPSPNPDYPQEIKSVVNPVVKVTGKNLLGSPILRTTTKNGVTCTNNGDGTYTLNGTSSDKTCFYIYTSSNSEKFLLWTDMGYELEKDYKLIGCPKCFDNNEISLDLLGYTYVGLDYGDGVTINVPSSKNSSYMFRIYVDSGVTLNDVIFKPMLTTDLNATYDDFEPYKEQIVTLPYTLNAIPVSSDGNVTIDGQQYIADYVDFEEKQLVRMVGKIESYGSEEITTNYISTTGELSAGATVIYELSASTTVDLTDEEVQAFRDLATYYPTTNIFTSSDQLDPSVLVESSAVESSARLISIENNVESIGNNVAKMTKIVVSETEPDDKSVVWVQ